MTQFRPVRPRIRHLVTSCTMLLAATALAAPSTAVTRAEASVTRHVPATTKVDPATLPVGARPQRAWLTGLRLTSKQGIAFMLPFQKAQAPFLTLLGSSSQGFVVERRVVVARHRIRTDVFTVRKQGATATKHLFFTHTVNQSTNADKVELSRDGTRILLETTDRGYADVVTVVGVDGHRVARRAFDSTYVLDFSGRRIVLSDYATPGIVDWTLGRPPVRHTTDPASGADIAHDVVFLGPDYAHAGPTSLTTPGTTAWTGNEDAWLVSSAGGRVLGVSYNKIRVHAMSDGSVLSSVQLGLPGNVVAWESPSAYLAVAHGTTGFAIIRCQAATGVCHRTTPVVAKPISMSAS